ncbi:unnamed protein product [Meganyctiphanes norvegica]|uniref:RAP domain-containing protein n=1 Tax=Meganyctiphanes norvegica TaxID=48144 RepID=A0AAV2QSX4_MEGNR
MSVVLGGSQYIAATNVLPHNQTPDLVFCTDAHGQSNPIPSEYFAQHPTALKYPIGDGLLWNVVIIGGRNSFIRNTDRLRGTVHMKKRQLTKLGYHVSLVPFMEYSRKSLRAKLNCLERVLQESTLHLEGKIDTAFSHLRRQHGGVVNEQQKIDVAAAQTKIQLNTQQKRDSDSQAQANVKRIEAAFAALNL